MKHKLSFSIDAKAEEFCQRIVDTMVTLFGITESEAIGRLNKHWAGQEFIGEDELIYHDDEAYWAKTIYYEENAHWWRNEDGLNPRPFP